jgi:hypothetical protein
VSVDPLHTVQTAYTVLLLQDVGFIVGGLVWLTGVLVIFHYYERSATRQRLLSRAAKVIIMQLGVAVVLYALAIAMRGI